VLPPAILACSSAGTPARISARIFRYWGTGTSAFRRSEQSSRPGAIDRSGGDGAAVTAVRSPVRTSAPSSGRFHRRCPAHARQEDPRRLGS
jgi:hypothetical protein